MLSRALVAIFQQEIVTDQAVLRGGTALHKLFFDAAGRYSEDIDLVQRQTGPIGELIDAIREALDPWLGNPRWKQGRGRFTLIYRFETTFEPVSKMRLKIEINTREHFNVLGIRRRSLTIENPWFCDSADLAVFHLDELLGTKLRALFQRKKGRDLFDLWHAIDRLATSQERILACFNRYMHEHGLRVTRAVYEENLAKKLADSVFCADMTPLLRPDLSWNPISAARIIQERLISGLPGESWAGQGSGGREVAMPDDG